MSQGEEEQVQPSQFDELVGGYPLDEENRFQIERDSTDAEMLMMGDLPEKVDPREHPQAGEGFLQVENQGSIGSCQGNSLTDCAEFCYLLATGVVMQFSRMFAYLVSQMVDGIRGDRGSTLSGGTKSGREIGFCPESEAPYPRKYPGWGWVTSAMKALAEKFRLMSHTVIESADGAKRYLGSGIGILHLGCRWNGSMDPDSDGCITSFRSWGGGGHAVVIVGYVPDSVVGRKSTAGYWFLLKNSWGKRWGINGYAYVDPSVIDEMLKDRFTVLIGRSDMKTPTPRPEALDFTKASRYGYADFYLVVTLAMVSGLVLASVFGCEPQTKPHLPEWIPAIKRPADVQPAVEVIHEPVPDPDVHEVTEPQTKRNVPTIGKPAVILHGLDPGQCPPCERWKLVEKPKLEAAGVEVFVYPDARHAPTFDVFDGKRYLNREPAGYRTAGQILQRLGK